MTSTVFGELCVDSVLIAWRDAGQIENPEQEMALRLSSHLLVGLSKIYTRKVQFLFTDCNEALSKITLVSGGGDPLFLVSESPCIYAYF